MDRRQIEQWSVMIREDMWDARRRLERATGRSHRFLRDKIAENEVILQRLDALAHAVRASEALQPPVAGVP